MSDYSEMNLEDVLKAASNLVVDHMVNQGVDVDHPSRYVLSILATLGNAEALAVQGIFGFAIEAKFILGIAEALNVTLPEALNDRLHGRIVRP